eukprot:747192-Amphidinium_carterae.1
MQGWCLQNVRLVPPTWKAGAYNLEGWCLQFSGRQNMQGWCQHEGGTARLVPTSRVPPLKPPFTARLVPTQRGCTYFIRGASTP